VATIEDVARMAGVSKATVSRVLGGRRKEASVREETRYRIEKAASQLGYRPSLFARGLKTKRTRLIGVVVRDLTNPFWGGIVEGITRSCHDRGYHVTISHALSQSEQVTEGSLLTRMGWDGLLLCGDFREEADRSAIAEFVGQVRGVVGVARSSGGLAFPTVRADNALGVRQALDLLYSLGHRRIGFIGGASGDAAERFEAFGAFCDEREIRPPAAYVQRQTGRGVLPIRSAIVFGRFLTRRMLRLVVPPTAILATTDFLTLGVLFGAQAEGCRVPEDLSVIGFDTFPLTRYTSPPLTMVHQPVREMGAIAIELLIDIIEGRRPKEEALDIRLPTRLVQRGSCAPVCVPSQVAGS
jgi:DNA-binding LacI/PurR family transcriptional regulator